MGAKYNAVIICSGFPQSDPGAHGAPKSRQSDKEKALMHRLASAFLALSLVAAVTPGQAAVNKDKLLNPASMTEKAPDTFNVKFTTSQGDFTVEVNREWAPNGADRFYNLVKQGFYDECRFFRAVPGFMVQFGINGDPAVNAKWQTARIPPDPVKKSNTTGWVSFAMAGRPDTRTTQIFINYSDRNASLDGQGFAPFGRVSSGMSVVEKLYGGYGDGAPRGTGPDQGRIQAEGNSYLVPGFPKLDFIKTAVIVPAGQ
jgi:peptidyl-prolyl cis-trans isomerase A (cyclophilin A)